MKASALIALCVLRRLSTFPKCTYLKSQPHTKTDCEKTRRTASNQHYPTRKYHFFLKASVADSAYRIMSGI